MGFIEADSHQCNSGGGKEKRRGQEEWKRRQDRFVGVDLHRFKWHVMVRTENQELFIRVSFVVLAARLLKDKKRGQR
jgi:hypothetical protein